MKRWSSIELLECGRTDSVSARSARRYGAQRPSCLRLPADLPHPLRSSVTQWRLARFGIFLSAPMHLLVGRKGGGNLEAARRLSFYVGAFVRSSLHSFSRGTIV